LETTFVPRTHPRTHTGASAALSFFYLTHTP
jgi:hypothetical protein